MSGFTSAAVSSSYTHLAAARSPQGYPNPKSLVDRRRLKNVTSALGAEAAALGLDANLSTEGSRQEQPEGKKKRGRKPKPKSADGETLLGVEVATMLQTQNETVLNAILDKGEEALVGVLFMLHDEESVERCSHEMVGSEEEWPTYTYKASTNQGSAKLAKTFTPWWSLLTHLKDKVWQSAKEKTTVFEQTMSLATGLEMLTELTPQHEEVRKMLTYIDPPCPQPKPPCAAILTRFNFAAPENTTPAGAQEVQDFVRAILQRRQHFQGKEATRDRRLQHPRVLQQHPRAGLPSRGERSPGETGVEREGDVRVKVKVKLMQVKVSPNCTL